MKLVFWGIKFPFSGKRNCRGKFSFPCFISLSIVGCPNLKNIATLVGSKTSWKANKYLGRIGRKYPFEAKVLWKFIFLWNCRNREIYSLVFFCFAIPSWFTLVFTFLSRIISTSYKTYKKGRIAKEQNIKAFLTLWRTPKDGFNQILSVKCTKLLLLLGGWVTKSWVINFLLLKSLSK